MQTVLEPKIVAVMAPKGGVGKTTCVMGLLVSARLAGLRVLGIDMDPQCSLGDWGVARMKQRAQPGGDKFADVPVQSLRMVDHRRITSFTGMDLVVIDTPPGHQQDITVIEALCDVADLVLIPTQQGGQDILKVMPFVKRLRSRRSFFVLNRVKRRTRTYTLAKARLMRSARLCPVDIPDRDVIGAIYDTGLMPMDTQAPTSEDFDGLWNFVAGELDLPPARDLPENCDAA